MGNSIKMPNANLINRLNTSQLNFPNNPKKYFYLAKKDKIDFIYNTAALEGNPMTYPEVETLLEGITVGGHRLSDEQQILNQNRSVQLLFSMLETNRFCLDKQTLCLLHREVAKEETLLWGVFREGNVNIGGTNYLPPSPAQLNLIFEQGLLEISNINNTIIKGLTYFLFGARSQFFYDGNKRVSRLMMNGILLSAGFPMMNIKVKHKLVFNQQMIHFYDSGDYVVALEYLRDYYIKNNRHINE